MGIINPKWVEQFARLSEDKRRVRELVYALKDCAHAIGTTWDNSKLHQRELARDRAMFILEDIKEDPLEFDDKSAWKGGE